MFRALAFVVGAAAFILIYCLIDGGKDCDE